MLTLYNTATGKTEEFKPLHPGEVGMYNCGPTVYNLPHIGNLRAYIFADVLKRTFILEGYKVTQIINITDVGHLTNDSDDGEDKVELEARKKGTGAQDIALLYTRIFINNLEKLNVETSSIKFPRATDNIQEQINLILQLEKKGFTYKTSDGIYFNTSKFKRYGKFGNRDLSGLLAGARITVNPEKINPSDFALWKFSQPHEKRLQEWKSPWGIGFPGWHLECSAMSMKYLGETFDVHTGGVDHIFPHHSNEIAQSEAATGKQFARYWLHSEFLTVEGAKMAKSQGTFVTLQDLEDKKISPIALRYLILTTHYRSQLNFTFEALRASSRALSRLIPHTNSKISTGQPDEKYASQFKAHMENDLDTPQAIALMWDMLRDESLDQSTKKATVLYFDLVLGLGLENFSETEELVPRNIQELAEKRDQARHSKDWELADELRNKILALGYEVKDTSQGFVITSLKN